MKVGLDTEEVKFVEVYSRGGNLVDAVQAAFPKYVGLPPKDCLIKGKSVLRRYGVASKLNELFDEALLSPRMVLRGLYEEICDPSEKHPRIAALKLAAELLGMKTDRLDITTNGKSDDELREFILVNLNKNKGAHGESGGQSGPADPASVNQPG